MPLPAMTRVIHGGYDLALELHLAFPHTGVVIHDVLVSLWRGRW
jgi:hypothetical protein